LFAVGYVAYSWYAKEGGRFSSGLAGQKINHDAHLIGALAGLLFVLVTDPGAYTRLLRTVLG
jgi:membrane associated rhomboid family serine protease